MNMFKDKLVEHRNQMEFEANNTNKEIMNKF